MESKIKLSKPVLIEGQIYDKDTILQIEEAFKAGSNLRIMKKIESYLSKYVPLEMDYDIPDGHKNSTGEFIGYTGWTPNSVIRINFELGKSDKLYSIDLIDEYTWEATKTVILDPMNNIIENLQIIQEFITNSLEESGASLEHLNRLKERRGREPKSYSNVVYWIEEDPRREDDIVNQRLSDVYTDYVRSQDRDKEVVSQSSFTNAVKKYLDSQGLQNKFSRGTYKVVKVTNDEEVSLPQETKYESAFIEINDELASWEEAFDAMEFYFEELMDDQENPPYGMVVYGNGGTGKSFMIESRRDDHDNFLYKGAPNTKELVQILYENRDKELIIFDDADSVITNKNSANILKSALTDTGERNVYLPSKTGFFKNPERLPDIVVESGSAYFNFNASIVVITNLEKGIPDKALESRVYKAPIFMDKFDIIDKIKKTVDPAELGATPAQADAVASFLVELVDSGQFDIKNEDLSYRFFKRGLKCIKGRPQRWQKLVMFQLGLGIKTSIKKKR